MIDQTDFTRAILDPDTSVPLGLSDPQGRPAGRRFDVYRNNVVVSLTEALEVAFPVVRKLVGEANFKILAGAFLRSHPPSTPLLMLWGDEFSNFLKDFEPVQNIGYLPDVARLEQAIRESYHSADAKPIDPAILGQLSPDALTAAQFDIAPAVRIVASPWPILSIWQFNQPEGGPKPEMVAEDVIVTRADFDPTPARMPQGGAAFVRALKNRLSLGAALSSPGVPEDFDLNTTLGLLLQGGALTRIGDPT